MDAAQRFAAALALVESASIREWAQTPKHHALFLQHFAQNPNLDAQRGCILIVGLAIGLI